MKRINLLLSGLALLGFVAVGVNQITGHDNKIRLREVQLKDTKADLKELELKYDNLNIELDKADKANSQQIKKLEEDKQKLEQERQRLENELQAKLHRQQQERDKQAETARGLANAVTGTRTVSAAHGGSGCEWLRGKLASMGVSQGDMPAALYIAQRESGCNSAAQNPDGGACNVFQELPCGKWGGLHDTDAHLRGAINYANNRYGGWWGAHNAWQNQHWW